MKSSTSKGSGLRIAVLGLSLRSSWGNGHATTYRSLLGGLWQLGHSVSFLERDVPWYRNNADWMPNHELDFHLYSDLSDLRARFGGLVRDADAVILGSYVPEGVAIGRWMLEIARGKRAFYDIDTPITLEMLSQGQCDYLSYELMSSYDLYLSFTGGPVLTTLTSQYGVKRPRVLYCSADPAVYYPEERPVQYDLGYMGTFSEDRAELLEELLLEPARRSSSKRFLVAGSMYPPAAWPVNVTRREHLAPAEHRAFYCSLGFTLNLTRKAMKLAGFSPSIRLFEAAACGCAIISDYWDGLETLFTPHEEIALAETTDDLLGLLHGFHQAERRKLGQRARERVVAAHSGKVRARELEQLLYGL